MAEARGRLIIIGGGEDKEENPQILEEVARNASRRKGPLTVVTVASQLPEEMADQYRKVFGELGVKQVEVVDVRRRFEAEDEEKLKVLRESAVIFMTGGDQLRITSQLAGSPAYDAMRAAMDAGATIAGTSAGAAAMPETMIVGGPSDTSHGYGTLSMAPGLGFISGVIIDSHFAERGRMGRLLVAVAHNPLNTGLGIDEDTAVVFERPGEFQVIGSGAVYVVDGSRISYSSLSEGRNEGVIGIHDAVVHVLASGDCFNLAECRPKRPSEELR